MKFIVSCILLFLCISMVRAELVPHPFIEEPYEVQRLGWLICEDIWDYNPFSTLYGVALTNIRTATDKELIVFTDPASSRMIYCLRHDSGTDVGSNLE